MKKVTNSFLLILFPKINSPKGQLEFRDTIQALLRSIIGACIPVIFQSLNAGTMVFDWRAIAIAGVTGLLTYLGYGLSNGKKAS